MTALPAVRDAGDAADLLRELFERPPAAAVALAAPNDAGPYDAVLRWLQVALEDLPDDQAALLRQGAAQLLHERALAGYVICLVEAAVPTADVTEAACAVADAGEGRGAAATPMGGADLHALVLGLCARLGVAPSEPALLRDLEDPRYRDLALMLAASSESASLGRALAAYVSVSDPADSYAAEALGRAFAAALRRFDEDVVLGLLSEASAGRPLLAAGVREAVEPGYLAWLTDAQRGQELEALHRQPSDRAGTAYLRLRLDGAARRAFIDRADAALGVRT